MNKIVLAALLGMLAVVGQAAPSKLQVIQNDGFNGDLRESFYDYDLNNDGYIDKAEFTKVFGPEDIFETTMANFLFETIDTNNNEKLCLTEVQNFVSSRNTVADDASPSNVEEVTFECTYRCGIWNTCMMKGAWNGDYSGCGTEPAECQCVW